MKAFPNLLTQRLRLGKTQLSDIPRIIECANNKNISDNLLTMPFPYTEQSARLWIEIAKKGFEDEKDFIFGIYLLDSNDFIGGIGLHLDKLHQKAELAYWIAEPYWNLRFASEAGKKILRFGFEELKLNKIFASHFLHNPSSGGVLEKIGMQKEALLKAHYFKNGNFLDVQQQIH